MRLSVSCLLSYVRFVIFLPDLFPSWKRFILTPRIVLPALPARYLPTIIILKVCCLDPIIIAYVIITKVFAVRLMLEIVGKFFSPESSIRITLEELIFFVSAIWGMFVRTTHFLITPFKVIRKQHHGPLESFPSVRKLKCISILW